MREFNYMGESQKLSKALKNLLPGLTPGYFKMLLGKKDIKINDKRTSTDCAVNNLDNIKVYCVDEKLKEFKIEVVYSDKNIYVFNKPIGISSENFSNEVNKIHNNLTLVHRLDTNTNGLIIFATSQNNFNELKQAFKDKRIKKYYTTLVAGYLGKENNFKAYLVKDENTKIVKIYNKPIDGAEEILTLVKPVKDYGGFMTIEVQIPTGKTHQIRAHLAYLSYPIVGDCKYGNFDTNKKMKLTSQLLTATKLQFKIAEYSKLKYLNDITIEIPCDFDSYFKQD